MSNSTYKWDPGSAANKLKSGITLNVSIPVAPLTSVGKSIPITKPNNDLKDAYRKCSNCGKHYNYHKGGLCPK